ncbi:MAG: ABC transporter permease [Roseiarcus sp.]|jgi:ribose transport system permease protein
MSVLDASVTRRPNAGVNLLLGLTLLGLLLLMWLALSLATTTFWSENNLTNLARQGAMIAILAIGETFVIITAGIDLSVGAVVGFCSMAIALMLGQDFPIWLAIASTLGIGLCIGLFHAFGIVQLGLPPFIMTLASLTALRGIGLLITNGATISINNDAFTGFSRGSWLGVPNLFWMVLVVAIPAYVLLHQSRWGRYLFAIGSNAEAARLSGVNVKAIIYLAYVLSAVCASFVGVLLAMRIGIGNPTQAEGWELQAIASSVIGGTSLFGAIGSIHGPLLGSFILTTINNGANLLNLNSFWQRIITGLLIIVIVYFDGLRRKKR